MLRFSRWCRRHQTTVKFVCIVSVIFMGYQFLSYATLIQYQYHEDHNKMSQNQLTEESKVKVNGETSPTTPKEKAVGKPIFSNNVLGVAPEYWTLYLKQQQKSKRLFTCFASGRKISWDKVNDDFCDCPLDGSDEPSTSACMNGRFFCTKSKKHFAQYIPSSRVNDGICDCCDGSDEYDTLSVISCKNRC